MSTIPSAARSHEADLGGEGTETERYLRVAMLRFLLLHTHEWTAEVLERLQGEMRSPVAATTRWCTSS